LNAAKTELSLAETIVQTHQRVDEAIAKYQDADNQLQEDLNQLNLPLP
jgi:hypothetical protein